MQTERRELFPVKKKKFWARVLRKRPLAALSDPARAGVSRKRGAAAQAVPVISAAWLMVCIAATLSLPARASRSARAATGPGEMAQAVTGCRCACACACEGGALGLAGRHAARRGAQRERESARALQGCRCARRDDACAGRGGWLQRAAACASITTRGGVGWARWPSLALHGRRRRGAQVLQHSARAAGEAGAPRWCLRTPAAVRHNPCSGGVLRLRQAPWRGHASSRPKGGAGGKGERA